MAVNAYDKGDKVRCRATFTNSAGVAIDPTAVFISILGADETVPVIYQYGVGAAVVRSSAGIYYVDTDTTNEGLHHYKGYSTGTGQAAATQPFMVKRTPF